MTVRPWFPAAFLALVGTLGWAQVPGDAEPMGDPVVSLDPVDPRLPEPFAPPAAGRDISAHPLPSGGSRFPSPRPRPGHAGIRCARVAVPQFLDTLDTLDTLDIPGLAPSGSDVFILPPEGRLTAPRLARPAIAVLVSAFAF